ncbi:MAG: hypothetical protein RL748_417, partial [Pseudomonadota bacterium]
MMTKTGLPMAKIHTHYDNLKVARMAPPEVIRAAYKALSQKYHPDKNPGDEKAARIMAILNTAYGTLSDPLRRKEHDEWISAEEWEVDWLESTEGKDSKIKNVDQHHNIVAYRPARDPKLWALLLGCIGLGWFGAVLLQTQTGFMSAFMPANLVTKPAPVLVSAPAKPLEVAPLKPLESRIVAISEFRLPDSSATCNPDTRPLTAPNGETWPNQSAYIEGYRVGNLGGNTQITLDNSHNGSDIFVKLFDVEKNQIVRYL